MTTKTETQMAELKKDVTYIKETLDGMKKDFNEHIRFHQTLNITCEAHNQKLAQQDLINKIMGFVSGVVVTSMIGIGVKVLF